nr:MAG TPA_asm: hypothetical protein [Caudoviricetes sp.]
MQGWFFRGRGQEKAIFCGQSRHGQLVFVYQS